MTLRLLLLASAMMVVWSGCVSVPVASYRQVDRDSAEFQQAFAREKTALIAAGESVKKVEKIADQRVTHRFAEAEKTRRLDQVAPLADTLEGFHQPRGCWAYVATTTRSVDGKSTVKVERFDPFQPEEHLWTLLSEEGKPPDEAAQAAYRKAKLQSFREALKPKKNALSARERLELAAICGDLQIEPIAGQPSMFTLVSRPVKVRGMMSFSGTRETYEIENGLLRRHTSQSLGPFSVMAGSVKFEHHESTTDYALVAPDLPPFVSKTSTRYRGQLFGRDSGDVVIETVYTDYRRVKCYDDRFQIIVGPPSVNDSL